MSTPRATYAIRRAAANTVNVQAATTFITDFTCVPNRAYAFALGGTHYVLVIFSIPVTTATLTVGDWTVKKSEVAQSISSVIAANGAVLLTMTGTPFNPINQEYAILSVSYDGTDSTFVEAVGANRAVAAFTDYPVDPSNQLVNAAFTLISEQSSAPSTPASGYGIIYADNVGNLHYLNDSAVNLTLNPSHDQFVLAGEVFG